MKRTLHIAIGIDVLARDASMCGRQCSHFREPAVHRRWSYCNVFGRRIHDDCRVPECLAAEVTP